MRCYFAVFMPTTEGHYAVEFPDIPEAFTQGNSLEECMVMGADALAIAVEEYAKARKELPAASTLATVKSWAEEQKNEQGISPDGEFLYQLFIAPEVDMTPVRVSVSFPKSVLETVDSRAAQCGMTRSGFLATAALSYSPTA